ncbi:MAG: hypothetical protein ABIJ96_02250 [Elusimicrobiota bacterium]
MAPYLPLLHECGNRIFGEDFRCRWEDISHWIKSPNLVYVAKMSPQRDRPSAVASALITSHEQNKMLLDGDIREFQLSPFPIGGGTPAMYYSSLFAEKASDRREVLLALRAELRKKWQWKIPCDVFAIGCTAPGRRHLLRRGFSPATDSPLSTTGPRMYLGKHQIYRLRDSRRRFEWLR